MTMTREKTIPEITPNTHGILETVRFGNLAIAPENVRAKDHSDTETEIAELAESIFARGLLKNLVGYRSGDLVKITAGRRRWKAHAWLASDKGGSRIGNDHTLTVLIRDREHAIADSLAENTGHKTMTTAQEISAFRVLAKDGLSDTEIARTHGTAVMRVRMLLRLAGVAPMILKAFEAEDMSLETLKAFAARDDQKRQRVVFKQWQDAPHAWYAHAIRTEMLRDTLDADSAVAVFVGAQAYREAGGRFDVDLFTEDESAAWLDVDLANRLASEKIEAEAALIKKAEGWNWSRVELDPRFYIEGSAFARIYPKRAPYSDADTERMEALDMILDADPDDAAASLEWHEIEARYPEVYPAQAIEIGGFILVLNDEGGLTVERGLIRAEDAPAEIAKDDAAPDFEYVNPNASKTANGSDGDRSKAGNSEISSNIEKPLYTGKHRDRLKPIRRAAFQEALAGSPALAFDLTVFDLARNCVSSRYLERTPLNIRTTDKTGVTPGYDYSEATPFYDGFLALRDTLPMAWLGTEDDERSIDAQFSAFRSLPKADKERILAWAVAASADIGVMDQPHNMDGPERFAEQIAQEAKADIRKGWTPDGGFFNSYRKDALLDILSDLLGGTDAEFLREAAKMTKAKLADEIGLMFGDDVQRGVLTKATLKRVDAWRPLGTAFDGAPEPQEIAQAA